MSASSQRATDVPLGGDLLAVKVTAYSLLHFSIKSFSVPSCPEHEGIIILEEIEMEVSTYDNSVSYWNDPCTCPLF